LQVWADTLPDLFVGAAKAMYTLMAEVEGLVATDWRQLRLQALDGEALLVDWLNELLFLTETDGLLFVDCQIETLTGQASTGQSTEHTVESANGVTLSARVGGVSAPVTKAHIKAATFHGLEITHNERGWSTQITFDV
jgi:SHS2 domain-containing protein